MSEIAQLITTAVSQLPHPLGFIARDITQLIATAVSQLPHPLGFIAPDIAQLIAKAVNQLPLLPSLIAQLLDLQVLRHRDGPEPNVRPDTVTFADADILLQLDREITNDLN